MLKTAEKSRFEQIVGDIVCAQATQVVVGQVKREKLLVRDGFEHVDYIWGLQGVV